MYYKNPLQKNKKNARIIIKKLEFNEISEQIITKYYYKAKNYANLGKPCYVKGFIYIPLTSDHVKRWVDYIVIGDIIIHESPSILRRLWIKSYQRKQQLKNRKKKQIKVKSPLKLF